ncbi:hypothetical protein GFJ66_20195 [Shigella flexneri]|nr:hypothetical protein [Shigella flexneri]EFW8161667.1 hypothetical protein [Shigella flexneri]
MFHTIVSIKNDGHYFCRAGGNRPDGLNEPVTANLPLSLVRSYIQLIIILSSVSQIKSPS